MGRELDGRVEELAARQQWLITPEQLQMLGMSRRTVTRRVAVDGWSRWSTRVIALPHHADTLRRRLVAARLHQPAAIPSHSAGAELHHFPLLPYAEPEVTVRYRDSNRNPFARVHRSVDLFAEDIVEIGPLLVTSVARTAADLFTWCHQIRATTIVKDLVLSGRLDIDELAATHDRYARGGRPTTVVVRQLISQLSGRADITRSALEMAYLKVVEGTELAGPSEQVPLPGWVESASHADFAYLSARVIVEVDGRRWHGDSQRFEMDRRRDNAAQIAGWIVLRFTWEQVVHRPEYVLSTIRAAISRAA